ncbi:hypothetical protein LCGC14_2915400, partial [marine sediment metagenome]
NKKLDKFRLNKRLMEFGRLSWDVLIFFSKLTVFSFLIITAFTFWQNTVIELYVEHQIDFSKQVSTMLLIVLMSTVLVFIDILKNMLFKKKE